MSAIRIDRSGIRYRRDLSMRGSGRVGFFSAEKISGGGRCLVSQESGRVSSVTRSGDRVKRTSRRLKNHPIDKPIWLSNSHPL